VIRVSVEVCSEADHFTTAVRAETIEGALSLARAHYPGGEVRVMFPIEPEEFFVNGTTHSSEVVHLERSGQDAG
jgi:hypothetical protein